MNPTKDVPQMKKHTIEISEEKYYFLKREIFRVVKAE